MKTIEKKYTLPKVFAKKWLKALRSGKYKQTRVGGLYNPKYDSFCCLGVACVIAGQPKVEIIGGFISVNVADTYGIPQELNDRTELSTQLADRNDRSKYSFKKIADWIEKNVQLV